MSENKKIPVLPLRSMVLFPGHALQVVVEHPNAAHAVETALSEKTDLFVVALKNDTESAEAEDLYSMGVIASPGAMKRGKNGMYLAVNATQRAAALRYHKQDNHIVAEVEPLREAPPVDGEDRAFNALFRETRKRAKELGKLYGIPEEAQNRLLDSFSTPGAFTDQIAGFLDLPVEEKQAILEIMQVEDRMQKVLTHLRRKIGAFKTQEQINSQVQEELGERQREMYLRQQLKAIKKELGEDDEQNRELEELRERLAALDLPEEARSEVKRELSRLERLGENNTESQVIRTYLETIAELPWNTWSEDFLDLKKAATVLDEDHYGLDDVKDRILEFLAVRKLHAEQAPGETPKYEQKESQDNLKARIMARGPILLFTGPPGVGKTSIAKSIARSIGRKYIRVSLGGARDEADIRGHRRTYVGAMAGRIIQGLKQAGTKNPVFLLDEVDKLGVSFQGDPASALMEVLDPAQNDKFTDHYLGIPFDLSEVLFIATANYTQNIPGPLLDRMEVVDFSGYTEREKAEIAKKYLVPRQIEETGLHDRQVVFSDGGVRTVISSYTRESGVRQLEREIGRLCRKIARKIAAGDEDKTELNEEMVRELLGRPKVRPEQALKHSEVGVATGMYYTPAGGDIMFVEASIRELGQKSTEEEDTTSVFGLGNISLVLTGQLGDVMKESARAALTFAATNAHRLDIPASNLGAIEAHIHVPAGAIPKDGPSAGVTMATALASVLSGRPVKKNVAMTGEVTLRGRVLPIGGIKEKILGARRAGIEQIILPFENKAELEEIPDDVKEELEFHFVQTLDEVLKIALLPPVHAPYTIQESIFSSQSNPMGTEGGSGGMDQEEVVMRPRSSSV